jgi:competence protein ComEC
MVAVLGIALAAIAGQNAFGNFWCNFLFLSVVLSAFLALLHSRRLPQKPMVWTQLTIALGLALFFSFYHSLSQHDAALRLDSWERSIQEFSTTDRLAQVAWNPIACRGIIDSPVRYRKSTLPNRSEEPESVDWQTITTVRVTEIRADGDWKPRSLLMPLSIDGQVSSLLPGDRVELYGQWRLPSKPSNPGQFDQARRYAELGYAAQARAESEGQIKRLDAPIRLRLDRYLAMVSAVALRSIQRHVILGQSELTAALVLGQREQAEWRLQEELLSTGTIHMLSISGMHIEMVALSLLLLGMLLKLPRRPLLVGICVIVIAYGLLCGANPPVARATIMLTGLCFARLMGWNFLSLNFLAFAGVALVLCRTTIVFETGTQLSFMAVAVLILSTQNTVPVLSPLERLIESKSSRFVKSLQRTRTWAIEMLRTSFWVWFITAPLVWSAFHVVSPIAIPLNLLLWLPMLLALMAGLGLIAIGWLPMFGLPLGIVCGVSLWLVEVFVGFGERVPFGHFWMRSPPAWWLYGFYALGILTSLWSGVKKKASRRRLRWVLGIWFLFGLAINPIYDFLHRITTGDQGKLCATFIDVGHGTSILIETPDHEAWMYDAGRLGDHQRSYQVIVDTLWAMKQPRIDGLILSHADSDHYNGIDGLTKRFSVKRLYSTSQVFSHSSPLLQQILQSSARRGVDHVTWKKGSDWQGIGWNLLAMHPPEQGVKGSDNANSLSILIEFGGRRILLPGDLEPPGMQMLVSQTPTAVDVLMAPHHGSLNSKSDALLKWCNPTTVVISGSTRAVSPRVLDAYVDENREVFVTARDHAIRIEISGDGSIQKKHWMADHWEEL